MEFTCLEVFVATIFDKVLSGSQPGQRVQISRRFRDRLRPRLQGATCTDLPTFQGPTPPRLQGATCSDLPTFQGPTVSLKRPCTR